MKTNRTSKTFAALMAAAVVAGFALAPALVRADGITYHWANGGSQSVTLAPAPAPSKAPASVVTGKPAQATIRYHFGKP